VTGWSPGTRATCSRVWRRHLVTGLVVLAVWVLSGPGPVEAQFSPGELSRVHSELDDSAHCLECHGSGKRVNREGCLSCHEILASRIDAGLGLHSDEEYRACETCHIEHHGKDFELIWWGEEGRSSFDHGATGYPLRGAHAKISCEKCHNPQRISSQEEFLAQKKNLETTFLGLDSSCLSCHADEHRGQVAADSCSSCHNSVAWMPIPHFDHDETKFPLSGKHVGTECAKCHRRVPDPDSTEDDTYLQFSVAAFSRCTDCHRDPHEGRLGANCSGCHSTSRWADLNQARFDHDRTRFSLQGMHRMTPCSRCHPAGTQFRVARFDACQDCHQDIHLGQFAGRADRGACEACHTADRFSPATYTLEAHQESNYPLEGAHLAAACVSCHQRVPSREVLMSTRQSALRSDALPPETVQFRFDSTACADCHRDPHAGEVDSLMTTQGCQACHSLAGWREVDFDHGVTEFELAGKHVQTACSACHKSGSLESEQGILRMSSASSECTSCHTHPHLDQFDQPDRIGRCDLCHGVNSWQELTFDHVRDARFALDGAHNRAACGACHKAETRGETTFIRYSPLGIECTDCHGGFEPFLH